MNPQGLTTAISAMLGECLTWHSRREIYYLFPPTPGTHVLYHISPVGVAIEPHPAPYKNKQDSWMCHPYRLPLPARSCPCLIPRYPWAAAPCQVAGPGPHILAKAPPFVPTPSCCCPSCSRSWRGRLAQAGGAWCGASNALFLGLGAHHTGRFTPWKFIYSIVTIWALFCMYVNLQTKVYLKNP